MEANAINKKVITSSKILYVSDSMGDDSVAQKGNIALPYKTLTGAKDAASSGDQIRVLDGTFIENDLLKDGVDWYFCSGSGISYNGGNIFYTTTAISSNIICERGVVISNTSSGAININHASANISIYGAEFNGSGQIDIKLDDGNLELDNCKITSNSSAGVSISVVNGKLILKNTKIIHEYNGSTGHCIKLADAAKLILDGVVLVKTHVDAKDIFCDSITADVIVYGAYTNCTSKDSDLTERVNAIIRDSYVE